MDKRLPFRSFRQFFLSCLLTLTSGSLVAQTTTPEFQPITDVPGLPRVLLIGDSVSIAYTLNVRSELAGVANVHRIAANGGSTKTALGSYGLNRWLPLPLPTEATKKWDLIHFNHGLHDACYRFPNGSDKDANGNYASPTNGASRNVSLADYEKNLLLILPILRSTGAKLIFATTTSIPDSIVPKYVQGSEVPYNTIARRVMAAEGIPVNDLWDLSSKNYNTVFPSKRTFQIHRDVHFNPEGSLALGKQVAESIKRVLKPTFQTVFPQQEASNDSDRDGIPALIEYAIGGSSTTADGKLLPQAQFVGQTPGFTAIVRNDDPSLRITPQFATSLNGPWESLQSGVADSNQAGVHQGFQRKRFSLPGASSERVFFRLRVESINP